VSVQLSVIVRLHRSIFQKFSQCITDSHTFKNLFNTETLLTWCTFLQSQRLHLVHIPAVTTPALHSTQRLVEHYIEHFLQTLCTLLSDSSKFPVDLLTRKWTVNLSSLCVELKYVTLWISHISFYQIKRCISLQQRITKLYSELMSSSSKIM
jgi:hypothetical protein